MFERFADGARRTVIAAQVEAARRQDTYIGAEHLLMALFDPEGGGLDDLGMDTATLRRAWKDLEEDALRSVGLTASGLANAPRARRRRRHIPFTGSARKVLEDSLREAIALEDRSIEAEHIAMALASLPPTERATRILERAGIDRARFRQKVRERLGEAA